MNNEIFLKNGSGHIRLNPQWYDTKNTRKINLGISTKDKKANKYLDILESIVGQLSDGIWENSPVRNYWENINYEQKDNQIYFTTNPYNYSNPFNRKNDIQIKEYLANKMKQIAKIEMQDYSSKGKWARNNESILDYLGYDEKVSVADVYELYDMLKGRVA